MRVVVTGARGFLGRQVVHFLREKHCDVFALTSQNPAKHWEKKVYYHLAQSPHLSVGETIRLLNPEVVIHLAENPSVARSTNLDVPERILRLNYVLAGCQSVRRVIYCSSAAVYGDVSEEGKVCQESFAPQPASYYGAAKLACEGVLRAWASLNRKEFVILRPCAVCGPGATHGLVRDVVEKVLSPQFEIELWGNKPGALKPYIHVDDVALAFYHALHLPSGEYNISPPQPGDYMTVDEVASVVMRQTQVEKQIVWNSDKTFPGDSAYLRMSSRKLLNSGWMPSCATSWGAVTKAVSGLLTEKEKECASLSPADVATLAPV